MGISPGDFWNMATAEFFEAHEAFLEARGGVSQRERRRRRESFAELRKAYPDQAPA